MAVGQTILAPWKPGHGGWPDEDHAHAIGRAVRHLETKTTMRFFRQPTSKGIQITRLA